MSFIFYLGSLSPQTITLWVNVLRLPVQVKNGKSPSGIPTDSLVSLSSIHSFGESCLRNKHI